MDYTKESKSTRVNTWQDFKPKTHIITLKNDGHSSITIRKLKNEYKLLRGLNIQGVRKVLDYQVINQQHQFVLELVEARSLHDFIYEIPLSMSAKLHLMIGMTKILEEVHRQGIIHKDINPLNILVTPHQEICLTNFGIASRVTLRQSNLGNPEKIEGTLAYISPEQTGRMNRSVDYRTDLYALGATFYELLTRNTVFQENDALALVYAHLAKTPVALSEVDKTIPTRLSNIILKLLEKNPENRYQSAMGLKKDLEKCLSLEENRSSVDFFELGQEDFSGKLQIPEKLYGREQETQIILKAFERVKAGTVELTLVAGYSGTGKSVLVNETHRPLTATRGYFVEGKFDQFQRNIPFFAWIQAFKNFVDLLLTENEEILNYWSSLILEAVGDNGGVLTEVIPNLELVIGVQPEVTQLGGQEAQNRFNYVMQNFVKAITTKEHPLIIFIDDLQWADLSSLELLKTLTTDKENGYLLCVGAYRDNEVSATHPLISTIQHIQDANQGINEIKIGNLPKESVLEMLHETLSLPIDEKLQNLNDLILSKTRGNAFFIHRFLKNLYEEGLLQFNFESKCWTWTQAQITEANFTDNVVKFMAKQVEALPTKTQQLLEWAACIGNKFDLNTLQIVAKQEDIQADLDIAIFGNLIFTTQQDQYKFAHDRIQQAAYTLIPENKKQATHLEIGQLLYRSFSGEEKEKHVFDITNHYNAAQEIFKETDRDIAFNLNVASAQKAKTSASFDGMLNYIRQAQCLLPTNSWETAPETTQDIYQLLIEAEFLNTNFELVEKYIDLFLAKVNSKFKKAEILTFAILQKTIEGKFDEAINIGIKALRLLSINTPDQNALEAINDQMIMKHMAHIYDIGAENILNIPSTEYAEVALAIKIYILLDPPTYISGNLPLYIFVSTKAVELSLEKGLAPFTPKSLSNFALIVGSMKGDYVLGDHLGQVAFDLSQKANHPGMQSQTSLLLGGWIQQWNRPLKFGKQHNLRGLQTGLSSGELQFAMYNVFTYACNIFAEGQNIEFVQSEIQDKYWDLSLKYKNELNNHALLGILWAINTVKNNTGIEMSLPDQLQNEEEYHRYGQEQGLTMGVTIYCIYKAQALFVMGNYAQAYEKTALAVPLEGSIFGHVASFDLNFYVSLTYLRQYESTHNTELLERVDTNQTQMNVWATNCPENFLHKHQLIEAEKARIAGLEFNIISKLYKKAFKNAKNNHFIQDAALIAELYAQYLISVEEETFAEPYLIKSYKLYTQWGAAAKTAQMQSKYAHLLQGIVTSDQTSDDNFDTKTILKATHSLSQQVQLKDLIQEILHLLSQNSGANKITFLRKEASGWIVEADQKDGQNLIDTPQPYSRYVNLPKQVVNYVIRTKEFVLLGDVLQNHQFAKDIYFKTASSKSVFVVPIKKHDKMLALLYLENSLMTGAFHQKRYELINALVTQLAISMENTLLYKNLEDKVKSRTKALQQSNDELQVMNEELRQTQEELQAQRDHVANKNKVLEEFNTKINGSLKVAQTIQEAILPYQMKLDRLLGNYFVINRPKDVVSGDFYWLDEINGKVILVVADCTGHGIPGAFMTLIGVNLLDKIIRIRQITQPNEILNHLHEEVKTILKQQYTTNNKGMDASVISLEKADDHTVIQFSGAKNNYYYYADHLYEVKGDRKSIGGIQDESIRFTNQQLTLPTGAMLYLGSDGLEDQNNNTRKKFGRKRLQALLSSIAALSSDQQKAKIEESLQLYMQDTEQRDDILWMGVRL